MPASAPDIYFANIRTRYKHEYYPLKMGFVRSVLKDANLPFSPNSLPSPFSSFRKIFNAIHCVPLCSRATRLDRNSVCSKRECWCERVYNKWIVSRYNRSAISFILLRPGCSTLFQFQIFKLAENLCSRNGIRGTIRKLNSEPDKLRPPSRCVNIFSSPIFNANCSTRMPISFSFFFIDIEKNIRRH